MTKKAQHKTKVRPASLQPAVLYQIVYVLTFYTADRCGWVLLSRPAVDGFVSLVKMAHFDVDELIPRLLAADSDTRRQFVFNVEMLKSLAPQVNQAVATDILAAGARYDGAGWNSTTAAKRLYHLCGIPLVRAGFDAYRDMWLLTAAFVFNVELILEVPEEVSAAAFQLASLIDDPARDGRRRV